MGCNFLQTKLVDQKSYGILEVMGYDRYGLRQVQLYKVQAPSK